jgi:hypothetical protein
MHAASMPTAPLPPQLEVAKTQLQKALDDVEKRTVDLESEPWDKVEAGVIKLLGGPFRVDQPAHHVVALGLAAALGARLSKEHGAFWFPSRESPEGASLGFPEALIMLSPFGAVLDALVSSKLAKLEDVSKDIRGALGRVKFGGAGAMRLSPLDYQRLFDPGFVQLLQIDPVKLKAAFELTPERLAADLRDAFSRLAGKLPDEVKKQMEPQLLGTVQRLEPGKKVEEQIARAPRVAELVATLWAGKESTGSAPEEFWHDVALPLCFIGSPATFPPVEDEELQLAKQGVDPLFLFLDAVPFTSPAPEEEGLLGAFPASSLGLLSPAFEAAGSALRMIKVGLDAVKAPLEAFDPKKTKDALDRYQKRIEEKAGALPPRPPQNEAAAMLEAALVLLEDFQRLARMPGDLYLRRLTEAEAAAEGAMALVRGALQGPRIILT